MKKTLFWSILLAIIAFGAFQGNKYLSKNSAFVFGQAIDSLNGVEVFYNGETGNVKGRTTIDGYNIGLKYQCVEFVKRYYFEHYKHRMPNSYGHAKSFFDPMVSDGKMNVARNLLQFTNPSISKPQVGDLIVMDGGNYGHVAIVSEVFENEIEIIQQNPGKRGNSRERIDLKHRSDNNWYIDKSRIVGWLRNSEN
ncbi:MAG: CHAP domain-containing protein [Flavobacteriales bacterium]|nr:CHAP domain-containing protein [Flavobacteriales bacterium]MDG1346437.1 CHAP domain-containing protein [Crocinitomicaceae bacterium]